MAYPFPTYTINRVDDNICPMPDQVDEIRDYQTCMVQMKQCQNSATSRAKLRNNPSYLQYANWFDKFAEQQKSVRTLDGDGDGSFEFYGGCKLLLMNNIQARDKLWNPAKDILKEQLSIYHNNSNFKNIPNVVCQIKSNNATCS